MRQEKSTILSMGHKGGDSVKRKIVKSFVIQEDGTIVHIRGDTALFSLNADLDGMPITQYEATFSVKQYPDDITYLYQKTFNQDIIYYLL